MNPRRYGRPRHDLYPATSPAVFPRRVDRACSHLALPPQRPSAGGTRRSHPVCVASRRIGSSRAHWKPDIRYGRFARRPASRPSSCFPLASLRRSLSGPTLNRISRRSSGAHLPPGYTVKSGPCRCSRAGAGERQQSRTSGRHARPPASGRGAARHDLDRRRIQIDIRKWAIRRHDSSQPRNQPRRPRSGRAKYAACHRRVGETGNSRRAGALADPSMGRSPRNCFRPGRPSGEMKTRFTKRSATSGTSSRVGSK